MSARELLEVHDYSSQQENVLVIINVICSALSFCGALFILFNYFMFDEFKQNFAFKLIFCVAIGDLVTSLGNFFGNPEDIDGLCIFQGILAEAGALTSILWVTAISLSIWLVISRETPPTQEDTMRWLKYMHIVIWSIITFCTILPLTTNSYGPAGGWCWFKGSKTADNVWRFALFYIPLWICVIFMSFVYCRVWNKLSATANSSKQSEAFLENEDEESVSEAAGDRGDRVIGSEDVGQKRDTSSKSTTLQRMKYYPMILMICYLPATIRRLSELFTNDTAISPFWLAGLQVFFSALIGFGNAMVYGWSQNAVRNKDKEWCLEYCCCGGDDKVSVDFPMEKTENDLD